MGHPLDPLSSEEITAAVAAVRADGRLPDGAWFSTVTVDEWGAGTGRHARLLVVPGPEADVVEAVVALAGPSVVDWTVHDGARPALGFGEAFAAIVALHEHEGFVAALAAR
ncbi:MAG TPA: hypothetical protein VF228_10360, partial [Iamia sp.]